MANKSLKRINEKPASRSVSDMENFKIEKRNTLTYVLLIIYLLALTWLILFKLQFSISVMKEGRVINGSACFGI